MLINFMNNVCDNSSFLSIIHFAKTMIELITSIIVPIALIIMATVTISKVVFAGKEEDMQKSVKKTISKTIAACAVYFVPSLVGLLLSMLEADTNAIVTCYNNANTEYIAMKKSQEKAEKEIEKQEKQKAQEKAEAERKKLEEQREEIRKENEEEAKENENKDDSDSSGKTYESDNSGPTTPRAPVTTTQISYIMVDDLAVPLYYSKSNFIFTKIGINAQKAEEFHQILYNVSVYVKNNQDLIPRLETAGSYVEKAGMHGKGLAIDILNNWSIEYNGKTYYPYNQYSYSEWYNYNKFICEVCNGKEDCEYNVNYHIYHNYFKPYGWCWGGNWGSKHFDPMHFEYSEGGCSTSNKLDFTC